MEKKPPDKWQDLIARYLAETASEVEIRELEDWVSTNAENRAEFIAYKKAWIMVGMQSSVHAIDLDQEWTSFKQQVGKDEDNIKRLPLKSSRYRKMGKWWVIAASVALIVGATFWLMDAGDDNTYQYVSKETTVTQQLPDGSTVVLNKNSRLIYEEEVEGIRKVKLNGAAFFEVKRNETRPFVIQSENLEVKVLGTSFYVDGRSNDGQLEVVVASGKVSVTAAKQSVTLVENESAVYQVNQDQLTKSNNTNDNFLAWQSGVIKFDGEPLVQVVATLESYFDTKIEVNNVLADACPLTANYKDKDLNTILRIIEQTLNVQVEKTDQGYLIDAAGCE